MSTQPQRRIIKVPDGKICDYIDGKFRKDTPEDYVRQTIEKRLVNEHQYKPEQIKIEFGLKMGSRRPRADIVVFPKDSPELTQDHVWLIVECKKETVEPKNNKDGVEQLKSYMSACPNCEWGMWTNGRYREVLRKRKVAGRYEFREYNDIPPADGSLEDVDRPKRNKLKKAYEDNLLMIFRTCHNHARARQSSPLEVADVDIGQAKVCTGAVKCCERQRLEAARGLHGIKRNGMQGIGAANTFHEGEGMLKYLLAVAVAVLMARDTWAEAPTIFGFAMGMTRQQVEDRLPKKSDFECSGDRCNAAYLPHGYEKAGLYSFYFDKHGEGLYRIVVVFDCGRDDYGNKTIGVYGELKADLSGIFGEPDEEEYIADSPLFPLFPEYIESGERKLRAQWDHLPEGPLADRNLAEIGLLAHRYEGKVMVGIIFSFENQEAVEAAKRKARFGQ